MTRRVQHSSRAASDASAAGAPRAKVLAWCSTVFARRSTVLAQRTMVLATVGAILAAVPAARAEYAPGADPVSATGSELGDRASTLPAISRDGRYVAFRTESARLLGPSPDPGAPFPNGLMRKDLLTGALELVAPPGAGATTSISADGRYVLFETALPLAPTDANTRSDVYLRDMTRPLTDVGAYELVSSLDGPPRSPVYGPGGGAGRAGVQGRSLSLDGRTAVFWTDSGSNLPAGGPAAPRAQVFVRSLDRQETRLVTRDKADPSLPGTPVPAGGAFATSIAPNPVVSGDGTTVAWQDASPERQLDLRPGELPTTAFLWRDVSAGPAAPARRLTGVTDPEDRACDPATPYVASDTATGPCYGPFASSEAEDPSNNRPANVALSISDDGRRLVFMSAAKRRPFDPAFARPGVYLVDMGSGRSRKERTSEPVGLSRAISDLRPIREAVLSGDGRHIAFSSQSNAFDGPGPVGTFQSGELTATNAFVLDLDANSVQRVTRAFDGGDYLGPLLDPQAGGGHDDPDLASLAPTGDAATIAFQAGDGNLFVGDANGVIDVQVLRQAGTSTTTTVVSPPAPLLPLIAAPPRVRPLKPVHPVIGYVRLGRGGVATVRVRVPVAGRLTAAASGSAGRAHVAVATATRRIAKAATVTLRLRPSAAALRALRRHARLRVSVRIGYFPRGGESTRASRRYQLNREALT
jgi:Tol biopolymer transport system component